MIRVQIGILSNHARIPPPLQVWDKLLLKTIDLTSFIRYNLTNKGVFLDIPFGTTLFL